MNKIKVLFLLVGLLILLQPAHIQASGSPDFSLTITDERPISNNQFHVSIQASNLSDVYAYEINLAYDNSKLQFVSYTAGNGGFNIEPILGSNSIQLAHTEIANKTGLSGNATLATLTFKSVQSGNAEISLSSLKLVNSQLNSTLFNSNSKVIATIIEPNGNGQGGQGGQSGQGSQGSQGSQGGQGSTGNTNSDATLITPSVSFDPITKTLTTVMDSNALKQAEDQAGASSNDIKRTTIKLEDRPDANEYVLVLPMQALINNTKTAEIEIITNLASLIVPTHMLQKITSSASEVSFHIAKVNMDDLQADVRSQIGTHPVIELSLWVGGSKLPWNNAQAPVTVRIPYSPTSQELQNPEHIVVWYVDESGTINPVPSGKYDAATGMVTFNTTHFSTYAVAYVNKSFNDLQSTEWARKQIEVMAAKGIVNGISESEFRPSQAITRADFLVLLVRTLELNGELGAAFADVPEDAYYNEPLRIARSLGIAEGAGSNMFKPLDPITREDMMVLTARALQLNNKSLVGSKLVLDPFNDSGEIASYAMESVSKLVSVGLVQGYNQAIHPKATTTRAETVVLMYNIYNH